MLCDVCADIFADYSLEPWLKRTYLGGENRRTIITRDKWQPHHPTAEPVRRRAEAGCYICLRVLRRYPNLTGQTVFTIIVSVERQTFSYVEVQERPSTEPRGVTFHLRRLNSESKAFDLSDRSLSEASTGSPDCLRLAHHWLSTCLHQHRCSTSKDPAWYPTRLLWLRGDFVRLINTTDHRPRGQYATLSHCWGKHPIDVLTPNNINHFKADKHIGDLPPSFRDFCRIVLYLGFEYAWIDSFCILQGSSAESIQDWDTESRRMEYVYANSIVNIGASHSSDSRGGCFQRRRETAESTRPHRFQWRPTPGQDRETFALYEMQNDVESEFNNQHLFSRAWVAQERLLSSRMLHFGKDQLWWQCTEEPLLCESYPSHSPLSMTCTSINTVRPGALEVYQGNMLELWDGIMIVYTGCDLTQPEKDKLRAIQGVGSRIARAMNDEYFDGFFWSQLPKALCWQSDFNGVATHAISTRAPSWSWASMNGQLYFDTSMSQRKPGELLAAAVSRLVTSANDNWRTGQGRQALICLGRPFPIVWIEPQKEDVHHPLMVQAAMCGDKITCQLDDIGFQVLLAVTEAGVSTDLCRGWCATSRSSRCHRTCLDFKPRRDLLARGYELRRLLQYQSLLAGLSIEWSKAAYIGISPAALFGRRPSLLSSACEHKILVCIFLLTCALGT